MQDCGNFPIFQAPCNWKAKEELVLLEAIEQEDVSQCLPSRSVEEVQEHYNTLYIMGNIGKATWSVEPSFLVKDHTSPDSGPLSPSAKSNVSAGDLTAAEQQELGYMPCRDDYEREFDNEAESLISQLSVGPEEDELEVALKLAQVDMYSRRLRERLRRKALARDYRLLEQFCGQGRAKGAATPGTTPSRKRPCPDEDREQQDKMRVFCQFQSSTDHEQLFENLEREKELKARIKDLMRYRRNGITKLDGGDVGEGFKEATDISTMLSYELLSEKERKLCQSMGISPTYYITFKTVVLKDQAQRRRQGSPSPKFRSPSGLDKSNSRRILSHFANSGWISAN
ncbi:transcriptional adaptor, putative [Ixodes scapularis]|uniref:Transcriptional adaptor, putative n=1 Tax=Ixodes scapularis TaxID=6945 RepID=B7Q3F2_IXOSC|nr:transcriptional adaptor, putative [Ixodes scapularis]|eukprot:XP_002411250.1 transcriptional adaptor, putative [Ixodes scapularis]